MFKATNLSYHVKGRMGRDRRVVKLVDNVSINVEKGNIVAIYGDRYSGKYFLLRMLTGLIRPTSGEIRFKDIDVLSLNKRDLMMLRRKVQTYFMDPLNIFGFRSVEHHLKWLQDVLGGNYIDIVENFLGNYGISLEDIRSKPLNLPIFKLYLIYVSSGLLAKPELLILENPTALIEYRSRDIILNFINDLRDMYGLTILLTTSDVQLIKTLPDYVYVMYRGRIIEEGSREDVVAEPLHPYTKELIKNHILHDVSDYRMLGGESISLYNWNTCPYSQECMFYRAECNQDIDLFESGDRRVRCILYKQ